MLFRSHGVEPRSPFVHPAIIKFAINLPWKYKVENITKPLLKKLFLETWPVDLILPKQGFAGHCNDSYQYLNLTIPRQEDRHKDWKLILQAVFKSREM